MNLKDTPELLRIFLFHGVDVPEKPDSKGQATGLCPWCNGSDKFSVQVETGKWHCVKCSESGNNYTFLQKLYDASVAHDASIRSGGTEPLTELSEERRVPIDALIAWGVCRNFLTDEILIPAYNPDGKLANLYKGVYIEGKFKPFGSPGCKQHACGSQLLTPEQTTIYICEGFADAAALWSILGSLRRNGDRLVITDDRENSLLATEGVIAAPGAATFHNEWLTTFLKGRTVKLLFDNDHPRRSPNSDKIIQGGWQGMMKALKLWNDLPPSKENPVLHYLQWGTMKVDDSKPDEADESESSSPRKPRGKRPLNLEELLTFDPTKHRKPKTSERDLGQPPESYHPKLADGYDVRDLIRDAGPSKAYRLLINNCKKAKHSPKEEVIEAIEPLPRFSFAELKEDYATALHMTPHAYDALAVVLSIVLSTELGGDGDGQLWFRLIGPPGCLSGDTEVNCLRAKKGFRIKISDLYHRFHGGVVGGKVWQPQFETYIQTDVDGHIRKRRVLDVMYSGKKQTYTLTTASGKSITATADHRIFTPAGWKRLGELRRGMEVMVNGGRKTGRPRKKKSSYIERCGLLHHPHAYKTSKRYRNKGSHRVLLSRLTVEADMNGVSLPTYIQELKTNPYHSFKVLTKEQVVHHKDENPKNNALTNLTVCANQAEHNLHHMSEHPEYIHKTKADRIVSIRKCKVEETYDIAVEEPHNFLANGIVVHNSLKTTLAEAISVAREYCMPKSVLTGFHSGFIDAEDRKKDCSLIGDINNKTVVIKDADTLISSKKRDTIMSELRDIFDGVTRNSYLNGVKNEYDNIRTTFLLCGTGSLRTLNRSFLGERFLDIEVYGGESVEPIVDKVFENTFKNIEARKTRIQGTKVSKTHLLKAATYGYLKYLKENLHNFPMPTATPEATVRIKSLAHVLAYLRARVAREKGDDNPLFKGEVEIPSRLTSQLTILAVSLAIVLGRTSIDDEVLRILSSVVTDTAKSTQADIIAALHKKQMSYTGLEKLLNATESSIRRYVKDMASFNMVEHVEVPNPTGIRGRQMHLLTLTQSFRELYDRAFGLADSSQYKPAILQRKLKPKPKIKPKPLAVEKP